MYTHTGTHTHAQTHAHTCTETLTHTHVRFQSAVNFNQKVLLREVIKIVRVLVFCGMRQRKLWKSSSAKQNLRPHCSCRLGYVHTQNQEEPILWAVSDSLLPFCITTLGDGVSGGSQHNRLLQGCHLKIAVAIAGEPILFLLSPDNLGLCICDLSKICMDK